MKYRKLRIGFSAVCGILSLLLIALWARSYWQCEYLLHMRSGNRLTIVGSNTGAMYLLRRTIPGRFRPPLGLGWNYHFRAAESAGSFRSALLAADAVFIVPHWLSVAVAAAGAGIPWLSWSNRFSLRALLIAMTLVALLLGVVVWAVG